MKADRRREWLLFAFLLATAAAMLARGVMLDHIPETLFNATLV